MRRRIFFLFIKVKRLSWGDTVWEICRQVSIRSNVDCQFRSSVVAVEETILVHIGFEIENLTRNYFLPSTMVTFSSFFLYFSFLICIFRMNIQGVNIFVEYLWKFDFTKIAKTKILVKTYLLSYKIQK